MREYEIWDRGREEGRKWTSTSRMNLYAFSLSKCVNVIIHISVFKPMLLEACSAFMHIKSKIRTLPNQVYIIIKTMQRSTIPLFVMLFPIQRHGFSLI